jgi:hypothetical protein
VYCAYEVTSTMASTSLVGRMPPAAGSVTKNPVVHPPTNTRSSSTGASSRTTDSKSARLGSATQQSPEPHRELALSDLSFAGSSIAERIDEGEQLVERRIFPDGRRYRSVERLERHSSDLTFWVWPYRWEVVTPCDSLVERRGSVRGRDSSGNLTPERGEGVLHAVEEELLDRAQVRFAGLGGNQPRAFEALEIASYPSCAPHSRWPGETSAGPRSPESHGMLTFT